MRLVKFLKMKEEEKEDEELQYGAMKCIKLVPKMDKIKETQCGWRHFGIQQRKKIYQGRNRTTPVPFKEIDIPKFKMNTYWNMHQLSNHMQTWSAVKKYGIGKNTDPLDLIR